MKLPIQDLVKGSEFYKNLTSPDPTITIDNSSFTLIDQCDVKGALGSVLKLSKSYESNDLNFGSVVHDCIDFYHSTNASQEEVLDVAEAHELWETIHDDKGYKTKANLLRLLEKYCTQYELDNPYKFIEYDNKILSEKSFVVPIGTFFDESNGDVKVYWKGKLDGIVERHKKMWVLDHKTCKQLGQNFLNNYMRSNQFLGYYNALVWIMENFDIKGLPPLEGALINALCVRKHDVEIPEPYALPFIQRQLPEWRQDILNKLEVFCYNLDMFMGNLDLIPSRTSCFTYGKCKFWDVCQTLSPEVRRQTLESDEFITSTWDPLD